MREQIYEMLGFRLSFENHTDIHPQQSTHRAEMQIAKRLCQTSKAQCNMG